MSPLLTIRPSVSVTRRLLLACVVMVAVAAVAALSAGDTGRPTGATPAFLAVGAVCSAIVAYLLYASSRAVDDARMRWMAVGVGIACVGLIVSVAGQASVLPDSGPLSRTLDVGPARYIVWQAALAAAAVLALVGVEPTRQRLVLFLAVAGVLLAWTAVADKPFGDLVGDDGSYSAFVRVAVALLAAAQLGAAALWWRREGLGPTWGTMCLIALLALSAVGALAYVIATEPYTGPWWASLTLRAGQFAIPAVGLMLGFVGLADKLRGIQREIEANFAAENERAVREEELAGAGRAQRERLAGRIRRLIGGEGLDVALQPIVDLASGEIVGAEALARFTDAAGEKLATESCFLDAHALGLGQELELAAVRLALDAHDRLPDGLYMGLNCSPALLASDDLRALLTEHQRRPLVVELTEHQQVEDYVSLGQALDELRRYDIRVAIDDVGSGFSSFRHITRVNPEILKLDRSLVCGIDDDPVRQSLAAAIVSFAADVGAVVVSEGIETDAELACLRELAVGLGQGFFLGRPNLGAVEARLPEPV